MSNLISNYILNSFETIQKITTFLESEKNSINSRWGHKIISWFSYFFEFALFYLAEIAIIAWIVFSNLLWLYKGVFSMNRTSSARITLNSIYEALNTASFDRFTSAATEMSQSEAYLMYLIDFLTIHQKDFGNTNELKDKIKDNFYVVWLCVNLLLFLNKNLKIGSQVIPDFEGFLFKKNVIILENSIDYYAAKVSPDLGKKCLQLKNLKKENPMWIQKQIEQFISEIGDTGQTPKTLALLDYLDAQSQYN
jgi:hypothetical protein